MHRQQACVTLPHLRTALCGDGWITPEILLSAAWALWCLVTPPSLQLSSSPHNKFAECCPCPDLDSEETFTIWTDLNPARDSHWPTVRNCNQEQEHNKLSICHQILYPGYSWDTDTDGYHLKKESLQRFKIKRLPPFMKEINIYSSQDWLDLLFTQIVI